MEIRNIIEQLKEKHTLRSLKEYVAGLKFETRFNSLRELIYHVDIYLAEGFYEHADTLLQAGEKLSKYIDSGFEDRNPKDVRSLKVITKKKRAKYYDSKGQKEEAAGQYRIVMKGLNMPKDETFMAEMLMELAILEEQLGMKKKALTKFDKASKLYGKKQDSFNYQAALFNCAHVLYDLNFYDKAEEFCKAVIGHSKPSEKMRAPTAHAYLELANIYEILEHTEKAKIYYKKALDSYRQLNDRVKMSDILNRIGTYEIEDGNLLSAAAVFHEALDIKRTVDFMQGKAEFYEQMADQMRWGDKPEDALNYYNAAYHFYEEAGGDSRKTIVKHKIFKILRSLELISKDMGTFIEKYKKKYPDMSKIQDLEKRDYNRYNTDGDTPVSEFKWVHSHSYKVNRKFLIFLLRNMARVNSLLGKEEEFAKYTGLKNVVEESYWKK